MLVIIAVFQAWVKLEAIANVRIIEQLQDS